MDEGFPGKLKVESSYLISSDNELYFYWKAWLVDGQDASTQTPINLANHTMWNISGDFSDSTIHDHELRVHSSKTIDMDHE
jgi:galactose mutarotase-like enzyme